MDFFKIEFNGKDITAEISARLSSISLDDKRGMKADDLSIRLEDIAGNLELPAPGSRIKFYLGKPGDLVFKGIFTIDEIEDGGPPDYIEIRATSADFTQGLKVRKERFFEDTTIGEIVDFIAGEHSLTAAVGEPYKSRQIAHISQTNESDLNLLSRLAKDEGGFFALKNMTLIFAAEANAESVSGQKLPTFNLNRSETRTHRFTEKSRKQNFTGAKAAWNDVDNAVKKWELAGDETKVKALPKTYADAAAALSAATAEFERATRGKLSMSVTMSTGDARITPERPVKASGFKPKIESVDWIAATVRHSLGNNWFSTSFDLEPLHKK